MNQKKIFLLHIIVFGFSSVIFSKESNPYIHLKDQKEGLGKLISQGIPSISAPIQESTVALCSASNIGSAHVHDLSLQGVDENEDPDPLQAGFQSNSTQSNTGDQVCDAQLISLGMNGPYSNVNSTIETGEPIPSTSGCYAQNSWCPGETISHTQWYKFVAPASGRVSIHTSPSNWNSQLALYAANQCGDLLNNNYTLLAANDDSISNNTNAFIAPVCVTPGQTYYVQIDGSGAITQPSFHILLVDEGNTAPNIICPANITVTALCNQTSAVVTWAQPVVLDAENCYTITSTFNSGMAFPLGSTTVYYQVIDGPYTSACSFVLNVDAAAPTVTTYALSACDSYTWPVNGINYTVSGTYYAYGLNSVGCPDTQILQLTLHSSTIQTSTVAACDSYTWIVDGNTYLTSGTYSVNNTNNFGCANTEILNLTINNATTNSTNAIACDNYLWNINGQTYSLPGTYVYQGLNSSGCTHTETLTLILNYSTSHTTNYSACDNYLWPQTGQTYTSSGIYSSNGLNSSGCNHTEILNLTINTSTSNTNNMAACGSYLWSCNGVNYTASGVYNCTGTNSNGCLHTEILNLTIHPLPVVTAPQVSTCLGTITLGGSPAGGTWNLPNPYVGTATSYIYSYTNSNGCTGTAIGTITTFSAVISALNVGSITGVSAIVTYAAVGGIGWYEVRWKPVSSSTWTVGTNNNATSKTITGLTANTAYEVQVRGYCSTSNPGAWSSSTLFSTNNSCGTPTNLGIINVGVTSATATWTMVASASYYSVRYRVSPSGAWLVLTSNGSSLLLPSLQTNTLYDVQIATVCGTTYSAYSSTVNFTTGTGCSIPGGLLATNITGTTVKLNWSAVTGATYYSVRYRKINTTAWTTSTSTGISKNISGLTLSSTYEFQVQSVCSSTSTSAWSSSSNFTTLSAKASPLDEPILESNHVLNLYPNPTKGPFQFDLMMNRNEQVTLHIYDISGRKVKMIQIEGVEGMNHVVLDLSDLWDGIYSVQIYQGEEWLNTVRVTKN